MLFCRRNTCRPHLCNVQNVDCMQGASASTSSSHSSCTFATIATDNQAKRRPLPPPLRPPPRSPHSLSMS